VNSCIFPFFFDLCTFIYLFYLVSILRFDACIVTITCVCLCVVISLWVIYLALVVLFTLGFLLYVVGGFLELFMDLVFGFNPDLEGLYPCIDCCGTRRSDNPIWAL
jgi:hypothetical protein